MSGKTGVSEQQCIYKWRPLAFPKVHCSEGPMFRRSVVPKLRCSDGSLLRRFVTPKLRFIVPKTRFNITKKNEFTWIFFFFVVFNSLMFLDLHKGRERIQATFRYNPSRPTNSLNMWGSQQAIFGAYKNIKGAKKFRLFLGLHVGCIIY